jgi:hypothetical protein
MEQKDITREYIRANTVDWSLGEKHMLKAHDVTVCAAHEALVDEAAILENPDPKSKSGLSMRVTGFSESANSVVCIILLLRDDKLFGINGWKANATYTRIYREGSGRHE